VKQSNPAYDRRAPSANRLGAGNLARPDAAERPDVVERPRERLHAHGVSALSEAELLALLLRTGRRGSDALGVASTLLARCGGLAALCRLSQAELGNQPGLGPAKAASLLAASEMGRRMASRRLRRGDPIRSPADVYDHFFQRMRGEQREHFMVLLLDGRQCVMSDSQVSQGTLTASLVHPREVFRTAVGAAAASLVLVHNHPSGDPTPSAEDLAVTQRLVEAGTVLGIRVLDHVVVGEHGYYSFEEHGRIDSTERGGTLSAAGGAAPSRGSTRVAEDARLRRPAERIGRISSGAD
jgi:DNA repair protein RadC